MQTPYSPVVNSGKVKNQVYYPVTHREQRNPSQSFNKIMCPTNQIQMPMLQNASPVMQQFVKNPSDVFVPMRLGQTITQYNYVPICAPRTNIQQMNQMNTQYIGINNQMYKDNNIVNIANDPNDGLIGLNKNHTIFINLKLDDGLINSEKIFKNRRTGSTVGCQTDLFCVEKDVQNELYYKSVNNKNENFKVSEKNDVVVQTNTRPINKTKKKIFEEDVTIYGEIQKQTKGVRLQQNNDYNEYKLKCNNYETQRSFNVLEKYKNMEFLYEKFGNSENFSNDDVGITTKKDFSKRNEVNQSVVEGNWFNSCPNEIKKNATKDVYFNQSCVVKNQSYIGENELNFEENNYSHKDGYGFYASDMKDNDKYVADYNYFGCPADTGRFPDEDTNKQKLKRTDCWQIKQTKTKTNKQTENLKKNDGDSYFKKTKKHIKDLERMLEEC